MHASNLARYRRRAAARADLCCAACGSPLMARRATKKACDNRCRRHLYRRRHQPQAHQRRIRNRLSRCAPRPRAASLDGYTVAEISRAQAEALIQRYEWLGNIGKATLFVGLISPDGELHGAVCFGHGPAAPIRDLIGGPALCLQRGACVHYAPPNAASFLISRAIKLVYRTYNICRFFAYADPAAGEYGGVYQAANWTYLGQGLNGRGGERRHRQYVLPPGADPAEPANWRIDRDLRRHGRRLCVAEARAQGWQIASRPAKHVYAMQIGRRPAWPSRSYPAPRPAMKRLDNRPTMTRGIDDS